MEKTILFQKNADVLTASGKQLGSLERVVLNPETNVITDIVIQGGTLFNKENRVIPIGLVAETTENQVVLRGEAETLKSFLPFEERRIVEENDMIQRDAGTSAAPIIYGVPGTGHIILPASEEQVVTTIERNIPHGAVALKEGARVITADEKHVGNVERVLADPSAEQVTHLLITQGLLVKEQKLIPINWVMTLNEDTVQLRVKEDVVAALESTTA